jgi:hypothetical protein
MTKDVRPPVGTKHSEDFPGFAMMRQWRSSIEARLTVDKTKRFPVAEWQADTNTVGIVRAEGGPRSLRGRRFVAEHRRRHRWGPNNQGGVATFAPHTWSVIDQPEVPQPRGQLVGATPNRRAASSFSALQRLARTWQLPKIRGDRAVDDGKIFRHPFDDVPTKPCPLPDRVAMPLARAVTAMASVGDVSGFGAWAAPMPGTRAGTLVLRPVSVTYGRARGIKAVSGVLAPNVQSNDNSHVPAVFVPSQVG